MRTEYQTILPSTEGRIVTVTLNRSEALSALNQQLTTELPEMADG